MARTLLALTRGVSPNIAQCELTHLDRVPIDGALAEEQHRAYEDVLRRLGAQVRRLPALPEFPDGVFVEDTAVVLDELAVVTRPGAASRRPETASVAEALRAYRRLHFITAPGTLDGGDVLCAGRRVLVGLSTRTNQDGYRQLQSFLAPHGYETVPVEVKGCLHLKSAVSLIASDTLLILRDAVEERAFAGLHRIEVHPDEPHGGNALLIQGTAVYPEGSPRTLERMREAGIRVEVVTISELRKAEAGVTCCSLILSTGDQPAGG